MDLERRYEGSDFDALIADITAEETVTVRGFKKSYVWHSVWTDEGTELFNKWVAGEDMDGWVLSDG